MARIIRETGSKDARRFSRFVASTLVSAAAYCAIGLIIFLFADSLSKLVGYIAGLLFIYSGIIEIYKYLKRAGAKLYSLNIIFGILLILVGVLVMIVPNSVTSALTVFFGLYLTIKGANKVSYGSWLKVGDDSTWLITIVSGVLLILLGVLVIANPFDAYLTSTKVVGIFLMLSSILDIANAIMFMKKREEIIKIFW